MAAKHQALSHEECTAFALAGLTALVSIEDTPELAPGETIMIQGGAGGNSPAMVATATPGGQEPATSGH